MDKHIIGIFNNCGHSQAQLDNNARTSTYYNVPFMVTMWPHVRTYLGRYIESTYIHMKFGKKPTWH